METLPPLANDEAVFNELTRPLDGLGNDILAGAPPLEVPFGVGDGIMTDVALPRDLDPKATSTDGKDSWSWEGTGDNRVYTQDDPPTSAD